jgi:hypothetical protein
MASNCLTEDCSLLDPCFFIRPTFKKARDEIKIRAPESFSELRKLEDSGFRKDPATFTE